MMSMYSMVMAMRSSRGSQASSTRPIPPEPPPAAAHLTNFHERVVVELKQKLARHEYRSSQRSCPGCGSKFLEVDLDHVPLEYCRDCHSWWFDADELMHFTELFEDISDGDLVERTSRLPCPVCATRMREQQLRLNSNLMVHVCPDRHGVYLQDGEFQRALEISDRVDDLAGHLNDQHLGIWRQLQGRLAEGDFKQSELKCVECGEQAVIVSLDGVEIDYCTQCQSCWFDAQELRSFTQQSRDIPGDFLTSRETKRVCPVCRRHMRLYQFHPKSNVQVEACPGGHGVYLESGQFTRVMKASE